MARASTPPGERPTEENLEEGGLGIAIIKALVGRVRGRRARRGPRIAPAFHEVAGELARTWQDLAGIVLSPSTRMLQLVNVGHKSLADYASIASVG